MMQGLKVYVPSWGLPLVFNPAFNATPTVTPQALDDGRNAVAVSVTIGGCTIYVQDATGRSIGGLVNWTAK